jgi:adenosylcobyric acid synthase
MNAHQSDRATGGAIMFAGTSANAGKTVFTRAACRLLARHRVRVAPFKPVCVSRRPEERGGLRLDFRLWLLGAAARWPLSHHNGPVHVLVSDAADTGELWIGGEPVCRVPWLAEDTPLLDRAPEALDRTLAAVANACEQLAASADAVVVEGSGSCTDLRGYVDVANAYAAERIGATVILVAGAQAGGAIAGLRGSLLEMDEELRARVAGIALNNVRGGGAELERRAQRLADECGVSYLGALPHCRIYDHIPPGEHSSLCDDEAEYEWLADFFAAHLDTWPLLRFMSRTGGESATATTGR